MQFAAIVIALQCTLALGIYVPGQLTLPPPPDEAGHTCVKLTGPSLRECGNVFFSRNWTELPNSRDHKTLNNAYSEFDDFLPILNCSVMRILLCYFYFPLSPRCDPNWSIGGNIVGYDLLPCRSVCELARRDCEPHFTQNNLTWPETLNCSLFPDWENHRTCFPIPPSTTTTTPSPLTTATTATTPPPSRSPPLSSSSQSPSTQPPSPAPPKCPQCAKIRTRPSYKTILQKDFTLGE